VGRLNVKLEAHINQGSSIKKKAGDTVLISDKVII